MTRVPSVPDKFIGSWDAGAKKDGLSLDGPTRAPSGRGMWAREGQGRLLLEKEPAWRRIQCIASSLIPRPKEAHLPRKNIMITRGGVFTNGTRQGYQATREEQGRLATYAGCETGQAWKVLCPSQAMAIGAGCILGRIQDALENSRTSSRCSVWT